MSPSIFDPLRFFDATTYFASQGRGSFQIPTIPAVFGKLTGQNKLIADVGWKMLQEGIAAKQSTLPMHQFSTYEGFAFSGPTRKVPHTQTFNDINVEFLLMGANEVEARALYHTFNLWQELIGGGQYSNNRSTTPIPDATHFSTSYYEDYTTTGELRIYAPQHAEGSKNIDIPIVHNKYLYMYPLSVGNITTSWDMEDTPVLLDVTFTFYYAQSVIDTDASYTVV